MSAVARGWRNGPPLGRVHDEGQRAAWLHHVVHRLGRTDFVCPVE